MIIKFFLFHLIEYFLFLTDIVDPNRDGYVSLQEYMAFMISKETENVQSSEEIENAFRAITNGERPYVTKEELYAVIKIFYHLFCKPILFIVFSQLFHIESHKRNGGLLRVPHESLRRRQIRQTSFGRPRLHGLYPHSIPELTPLSFFCLRSVAYWL